ncbi:MAG TPA: hypothetical protein VI456_16080 [Polyangia bacterium]
MLRSLAPRFRILLAFAVLGVASFGLPFLPTLSTLAQAKKSKKAPASTVDCKTDKDCVLVPDDCCPCSEGGKQRAIPKKEKDSYEKDRKKRCADTACTESVSTDPSCSQTAFCGAGICELGGDAPAADSPSVP